MEDLGDELYRQLSGVGAVMMQRRRAPAQTVAEMRQIPVQRRCTGKTSQAYQTASMMRNVGDFQFKIICGFPARPTSAGDDAAS